MKLTDLKEWLPWARKRLQSLGPGPKRDLLEETIAWAEAGKPKPTTAETACFLSKEEDDAETARGMAEWIENQKAA